MIGYQNSRILLLLVLRSFWSAPGSWIKRSHRRGVIPVTLVSVMADASVKGGGSRPGFPYKLYEMIENESDDLIRWSEVIFCFLLSEPL